MKPDRVSETPRSAGEAASALAGGAVVVVLGVEPVDVALPVEVGAVVEGAVVVGGADVVGGAGGGVASAVVVGAEARGDRSRHVLRHGLGGRRAGRRHLRGRAGRRRRVIGVRGAHRRQRDQPERDGCGDPSPALRCTGCCARMPPPRAVLQRAHQIPKIVVTVRSSRSAPRMRGTGVPVGCDPMDHPRGPYLSADPTLTGLPSSAPTGESSSPQRTSEMSVAYRANWPACGR